MEISDINLPKRKIQKTFRSLTGFFPSKKNGRGMAFESTLERNLFLSLEFDDSAKKYLEQPIKIEYKALDKNRSYHPDCLIEYHNARSKLIEVKYTSDLEKYAEELELKFNAARQYADKNNMDFDIFTENNITATELSNFTFLYSFATVEAADENIKQIKAILKKQSTLTVLELLEKFSQSKYQQAKILPYIWKMVFDGVCHIDYKNRELSMNSLITGKFYE